MNENITDNTPAGELVTKPKWDKKKLLIFGGAAAILIIAVIIIVSIFSGSSLGRVRSEAMSKYPLANGSAGWVVSNDFIKVDTNPDNVNPKDMTQIQYRLFEPSQNDSLGAIKFINGKLGFSAALYDKMMATTALMGRQTDENSKYRVSWTYHPDRGLEVMYEKR